MLKTWTDTHYKLEDTDWLYIAKHDDEGTASLICPGYARDGSGFSIHFTPAHIEILQHLLAVLQSTKAATSTPSESDPAPGTSHQNWMEVYAGECAKEVEGKKSPKKDYKYPAVTSAHHRHVIR
ncbi:hypothetical protein [Phormidium sp. CCY1219]|uniref:hypothetical protein n=1 Tax=Phormidium sp. CCY1219 TaxID=2886104 RepID=UPI002D1E60ED|nr:hypothetical protein [Phormidium sp. CCY1219]MEB3831104.1 hypothetical protein [Phormidium sp. CCY1219]